MIKILFICHGNICRSPMAEYMFRHMVQEKGEGERFEIASAATSAEELGNPVYPPAGRLLMQHGINCDTKRARRIAKEDLSYYNVIIVMDRNNLANLRRSFSEADLSGVRLLMEYAGEYRDVADPWYTRDFETTWKDLEIGLAALYEALVTGKDEI